MNAKAKTRRRRPKAPKARNPFVALARRRGHGVERSAKTYRRRSKHQKPPSENGGF